MTNRNIILIFTLVLGLMTTGCQEKVTYEGAVGGTAEQETSTMLTESTVDYEENMRQNYGVFLSLTYNELPEDMHYETLVIDAQYYTADEVAKLHENHEKIYSYINVGAIESFRDYYDDYTACFLGDYENWPEEKYVDVSREDWQSFILDILAPGLTDKGIDGFFIDNLDVYYEYPTEENFHGITRILEGLKATGLYLMVNGGDVYITEYMENAGYAEDITVGGPKLSDLIDAVNQEGVYTEILWDNDSFRESNDEDRQYFLTYLASVKAAGCDIYLIEYTQDEALTERIYGQCISKGYTVYVSDSVELD